MEPDILQQAETVLMQQDQASNSLLDALNQNERFDTSTSLPSGRVPTSEQSQNISAGNAQKSDHSRNNTAGSKQSVLSMDPIFLNEVQDETTVDEMKIQTMYKMVEDVAVAIQGKEVVKKVLYLTNKQANLFDEQAMARCVQALDLGEPKFVIILSASTGVQSQMKLAHTERFKTARAEYQATNYQSSEICKEDEVAVESQILLFMRTCILPLARQTRAIILVSGANDCYLSAALSFVVLSEQARLGKDCPFSVIATVFEFEIHFKAVSEKDRLSIAAQLARGSRAWSRRMPIVHQYVTTSQKLLQRCDLTSAASRYVVFESMDEHPGGASTLNSASKKSFEAILLQYLTRKLPSICIQSHFIDCGIGHLAELAARNIPILFLDSSERAISLRKQLPPTGPTTKMAILSDSFPVIPHERISKMEIIERRLTLQGRQELLKIACEMLERKWQQLIGVGKFDHLNASLIAFLHSTLRVGTGFDGTTAAVAGVSLQARIHELERLQSSNRDSAQAQVPHELANSAVLFVQTRLAALQILARLSHVEKWLESHSPDVEHMVEEATKLRDELKKQVAEIEQAGGYLQLPPVPEKWLELFDILTSNNTYSGSIHDLDDLKRILGSVAKIDRLPTSNSLEALRILQEAWDHVEMYHQVASWYKLVAKVTYILRLFIGMTITGFALVECKYGSSARIPVMILSFVATTIAAYITFTNPGQRWQQLRTAASEMESNIWFFRTRAGAFRASHESDVQHADKLLAETLTQIKEGVLDGADIKGTSFFSRSSTKNLHGQHRSSKSRFGTLGDGLDEQTPSTSKIRLLNSAQKKPESRVYPFDLNIMSPNSAQSNVTVGGREGTNSRVAIPVKMTPLNSGQGDRADGVRLDEVIRWLDQAEVESECQVADSHYAPVQPDQYLHYRVAKALSFYQGRIPSCNRTRNITQALLVLGAVAAGALAFFEMVIWAGGVSILTAAITAYTEFQGTDSKINRYSFTVHALEELIFWWQTLPQIDKSVVSNIDRLVLTCEALLQKEQQAWRATSQSMRLMLERAKQVDSGARPVSDSAV